MQSRAGFWLFRRAQQRAQHSVHSNAYSIFTSLTRTSSDNIIRPNPNGVYSIYKLNTTVLR